MAKWTVGSGIEEYISKLVKLEDHSEGIIKRSVYEGAKVLADAVDAAIDSIPGNLVSDVQRQGLHDGFGLVRMRNDSGFINTRMAFGGYNADKRYKTKRTWTANIVVARRVISGTSHQSGYNFVNKAVRANREAAEAAMKKQCDEDIEKTMN